MGVHDLFVEMFEATNGQQLTVEWKVPGSSSFTVIPNSVLSTEAGVVRVTAPGRSTARAAPTPPATVCAWMP